MLPRSSRSGFTLIEMLLVMGIVVILASILIPITLRLQESNLVPKAAGDLQGALTQAKTQAAFTNRRFGIRLIPMTGSDLVRTRINPAVVTPPVSTNSAAAANANYLSWYDRIEFVEDPGDFQEMFVWSAIPPEPAPGIPLDRKVVQMPIYFRPSPQPVFPQPGEVGSTLANVIIRNTEFIGFNKSSFRVYGPMAVDWADADGITQRPGRTNFNFFGQVHVGDQIEFNGNGQVYTIVAVNNPTPGIESTTPQPPNMDVWRGPPTYLTAGTMPRPSYLVLENRSILRDQYAPTPWPAPNGPALLPGEVVRTLVNDVVPPTINRPNYRIIRQPRPVPSLKPVLLPKETVLELVNPHVAHNTPATLARDMNNNVWMRGVSTVRATPGSAVDIMFGPSGTLVSVSSPNGLADNSLNQGMIHLWVHRYSSPTAWFARNPTAADSRPDNQAMLTIYQRTGAISSYRINHSPTANPWTDAATGRAQGIGGL